MAETKWIVNSLNGVHNKQLWNCIIKARSTLENIQATNKPFYITEVDRAPGKTSWRPLLYTNWHQLYSSEGKVAERLFFLKYMFSFESDESV